MSKKVPLVEMFGPTIQGEGAVIGQQTYFMRFGLCDYKCTMCDSMNAVDPMQVRANARMLTPEEILEEFTKGLYIQGSTPWITISGGNPCIHDLTDLVVGLKELGFKLAIETQGTFAPEWLKHIDIITVSPKGVGMGEVTHWEKLEEFFNNCDELEVIKKINLKVVVFDQRDLEFAKDVWESYSGGHVPMFLSQGNPWPPGLDVTDPIPPSPPHSNTNPEHIERLITLYRRLFEDIKTDPILSQLRFLPQWHVFVWGNEKGR